MPSTPLETAAPGGVLVAELVELAARGLPQMFDAEQQLFCLRMMLRGDGRTLVREGVLPRYTLMTLLGLHRWEGSVILVE